MRALLGDVDGQSDSDRDDGPVIVPPRSELATPLEVDEVRAIIRRLDGSGLPQKDLARRVGVPASLVSKLLNGRDVPIAKEIAERIRALQWF